MNRYELVGERKEEAKERLIERVEIGEKDGLI